MNNSRVVNPKKRGPRRSVAPTWLRDGRIHAELTAEQLAQIAGMSISKVLRIERNPDRARHGDVRALEQILERAVTAP